MVITHISPDEVLRIACKTSGLKPHAAKMTAEPLLAALVRRVAGTLCPCSPSTLSSAVLDGLYHLSPAPSDLAGQLETIIERLIVIGDLLELSQVTIDDASVKGTWVFIAPPSFVERPGGSVIVTGISPDEATPLPESLSTRVQHEGVTRILHPVGSEDLPSILRDLGFVELSKKHWLHAPARKSAQALRDEMLRRLLDLPPSGSIDELSILDPETNVTHYRSRWVKPTNQQGHFVARRPQAYGSPIWGFATVTAGVVTQFLDLPLKGMASRGCDAAWHLQMAIDASRGTPQRYRYRQTPDGPCLDFYSPLPLWAERRLGILGRAYPTAACLLSYLLPDRELATEETFLQDRLWLARQDNN